MNRQATYPPYRPSVRSGTPEPVDGSPVPLTAHKRENQPVPFFSSDGQDGPTAGMHPRQKEIET
jgi:hypothetical protein